jgi:hypothetical protein
MMSIPVWAHVGAKVVCIDDTDRGLLARGYVQGDDPIPLKWTVCVVAGHANTYGEPHLLIDGYPNRSWGDDFGWHVSRFRPLVTIDDDIATHFASLLDVREPMGA